MRKNAASLFLKFSLKDANAVEISLERWKGVARSRTGTDPLLHNAGISDFYLGGLQLSHSTITSSASLQFFFGCVLHRAGMYRVGTSLNRARFALFEDMMGVELEDSQLRIVDHRRRPLISH